MRKTHQCVHAFATVRPAESVSAQTPFLPIGMMSKEQTLRNMRDTSATADRGTAYTVYDMSVNNVELQSVYTQNAASVTLGLISFVQTEAFCPTVLATGAAEGCIPWTARVRPLDIPEQSSAWEAFTTDGVGCEQYANTYAKHADSAQSICKTMRTPRMAVTHIQNDMYNLFSAQNEMSLVVCWNSICLVFAFMLCLHVVLDHSKQTSASGLAQTSQDTNWPWIEGTVYVFITCATVIVLGVTLSMATQENAKRSNKYKDSLLPTGSIMITVISGGISGLLVLCSPWYVEGYIEPDKPTDVEANHTNGVKFQARVHTNTSWQRYGRFLLSRNDLSIAYCNFLTFPILVLLIYVRYNWYSVDVHVQRAFFSAVAVGVLNITEVSVMGLIYLITEVDESKTRRKFRLKYTEETPTIFFHHLNLINFTAQLIFFLSKMAVFIPTIHQIRRNMKWQYDKTDTEQFAGQKLEVQPLVLVMIAFFAMNHAVPLVHNFVVNAGIGTGSYSKFINSFRVINAKLVTFAATNVAVASIINFQGQ